MVTIVPSILLEGTRFVLNETYIKKTDRAVEALGNRGLPADGHSLVVRVSAAAPPSDSAPSHEDFALDTSHTRKWRCSDYDTAAQVQEQIETDTAVHRRQNIYYSQCLLSAKNPQPHSRGCRLSKVDTVRGSSSSPFLEGAAVHTLPC